ncbi:MAG: winged helix-turn-helix transcriptional regulator [Thermoplasmatota archaeon]
MAASRILVSLLLAGLVPAVAVEALPVPDAQLPSAQVYAGVNHDEVQVATDLPLNIGVDRTLHLPVLPDLALESRPDPVVQGEASPASASKADGPWQAIREVSPHTVLVGSSVLATVLALAAWLANPSLGMFSRIETDALAEHPLRRQALDLIAANPGATVQSVRKGLGIAWGTAVYHLGRLERAGLVAVRHSEGRRGHWPLGQAPARDALAPTGEALARLVRDRPGLPQNELARLAGIGPPAACKQLRRLESAGFVQAQRSGRTRLYVPTPSLDGVLAKASPLPTAA